MSDLLNTVSLLNNLLLAALNAMDTAAKVSVIISNRINEGRDTWTEEEKASLDAALKTSAALARKAVKKL